MDIEKAFRRSVYILPTMAVISMAVAEESVVYVLALLGLWAAFYVTEIRGRTPLTAKTGALLAGSAFFLSLLDYRYLASTPGFAMGHFLIEAQLIYLLMKRTERNYGMLFLMSLVNFILASSMTTHLLFSVELLMFLAGGVWTLVLLNIYSEAKGESAQVRVSRRWFSGVGVASLFTLLLAVGVFFLIPRLPAAYFMTTTTLAEAITGFSDETRVGDIAEIKANPNKVMRIWLERDGEPLKAEKLLVRGVALSRYENRGWSGIALLPLGLHRYQPLQRTRIASDRIRQRIELESLGTRTLFAVYPDVFNQNMMPPAVDLPSGGLATFDRLTDSLTVDSMPTGLVEYFLEVPVESPRGVRALVSQVRQVFLQVPDELSPRVKELAEEVTSGLTDERMICTRVEQYLVENYAYALSGLDFGSGDPVEEFLFKTKEGHCEYFASAMVMLLRTLGIPARFVNGFAVGEWNDVGGYYVIRQQDAHSWVEAYIDGRGWTTFDPTPPAGRNVYERGRFSKLQMWYDSLERTWVMGVLNYGYSRDPAALSALERLFRSRQLLDALGPSQIGSTLRELFSSGAGAVTLSVLTMFLAVFAIGIAARSKRPGQRRGTVTPSIRFYRSMLKILRRKGFRRASSWTPTEFANRVVAAGGGEFLPAEYVTDRFCAVRYGDRQLTEKEAKGLRTALSALRRAPKVKRKR